jgi:hypothetical protein
VPPTRAPWGQPSVAHLRRVALADDSEEGDEGGEEEEEEGDGDGDGEEGEAAPLTAEDERAWAAEERRTAAPPPPPLSAEEQRKLRQCLTALVAEPEALLEALLEVAAALPRAERAPAALEPRVLRLLAAAPAPRLLEAAAALAGALGGGGRPAGARLLLVAPQLAALPLAEVEARLDALAAFCGVPAATAAAMAAANPALLAAPPAALRERLGALKATTGLGYVQASKMVSLFMFS